MTEHRLFRPDVCLPGILKCAVCGEAFITAAWIRSLATELKAEGRPTTWLGTPEAAQQRRRAHAEWHVGRCEATLDRMSGRFLLAVHLRPKPKTASDYGFKAEALATC